MSQRMKHILVYGVITVVLILCAMLSQMLLYLAIGIAWFLTTVWEFSEDWSLGLIETAGTGFAGLALGNAIGVTGFVISMGVSIYGSLILNWYIMKQWPWMSAKWRLERREAKRAAKLALKGTP
jgi:hypothetical protein